eukprot:2772706-Alexandrium_andersonii.AAC.1
MPTRVERRLDAGRAVYSLDDARVDSGGSAPVEEPQEGCDDARIVCPDAETWARSDGCDPEGTTCQE